MQVCGGGGAHDALEAKVIALDTAKADGKGDPGDLAGMQKRQRFLHAEHGKVLAKACVEGLFEQGGKIAVVIPERIGDRCERERLGIVLFQKGTFLIGGGRASIISTFEPITSLIAGVIIFNEHLSVFTAIGTVLVIVASVLIAVYDMKGNKE